MVRTSLLQVIFLLGPVTFALGQSRVEVMITHVRDTTGTVMVALFRDPKSFLKKPLVGQITKAVAGQTQVVFENVEPGEYAASIIHDANRNKKLDTNIMGIPREGFGFSNDALGTFGPPSFDKAKFKVAGSTVIRIKTKYF
jgi:uncharacterized protein (DUF2141 family)